MSQLALPMVLQFMAGLPLSLHCRSDGHIFYAYPGNMHHINFRDLLEICMFVVYTLLVVYVYLYGRFLFHDLPLRMIHRLLT